MNIDGAVVIITGSATGLGAAVARRLAPKGANVVINYTKSEAEAGRPSRIAKSLGRRRCSAGPTSLTTPIAAGWPRKRPRGGGGSTAW